MTSRSDNHGDGRRGGTVRLGQLAGIPVRAHWSVLMMLLLVTQVLALGVLPRELPGRDAGAYWAVAGFAAVALLGSILSHELAHALTARRHELPVERITLWMVGGMTELRSEPRTPRTDAVIAVSGPATSLALGVIFAALAWLFPGAGLFTASLVWLAGVNVLLALFNLLPGAPLDGGRLLRALLWRRHRDWPRAAEASARVGSVLGVVFIAIGLAQVLAGAVLGLWLAFTGWMMIGAAAGERQAAAVRRLGGRVARDSMRTPPATAPSWWSVSDLAAHLGTCDGVQEAFLLVDFDGSPRRVLTLAEVLRVRPHDRDTTRLRDVARSRVPVLVIRPETPLVQLVPQIRAHGGIAGVVEGDRVVGTVSQGELLRAMTAAALGAPTRAGQPWASGGEVSAEIKPM